jgi:hypothetical protein
MLGVLPAEHCQHGSDREAFGEQVCCLCQHVGSGFDSGLGGEL